MVRNFIKDLKQYGFKTAKYNLIFLIAYKLLEAKSMRVSKK